MINQIRSLITAELEGFGHDDVYLANYGIMTTRSGTLSIDEDAFTAQYEANPMLSMPCSTAAHDRQLNGVCQNQRFILHTGD